MRISIDRCTLGCIFAFIVIFFNIEVLCLQSIQPCDKICSPADDYTRGHWKRIANVTPVSSAEELEAFGGYHNHSFYHLGNWQPHFCARRPVKSILTERS